MQNDEDCEGIPGCMYLCIQGMAYDIHHNSLCPRIPHSWLLYTLQRGGYTAWG